MEKRQRLAMLVVLTRFVRWLEHRGVVRTAGDGDRLIHEYIKTLEIGERNNP